MDPTPKTGNRVHLTIQHYASDYRQDDTGTVESGPHPTLRDGVYFVVRMDKDGTNAVGIVLYASEIEIDVM